MKLAKGKSIVVVLFLLLAATGFLASRANAGSVALNSIDLPTETHFVGEQFNVTATISNATHLFTWQVKIFFNSTVINCTGATYPSGHVFQGHGMIPVDPIINNAEGHVSIGASLLGVDFVDVVSATPMCNIEFEALEVGNSSLNYSRPYGGDTFALDDNLDLINYTELEIVDGNVEVQVPEFNVPTLILLFLFATLAVLVISRKALSKSVRVSALNSK